MNRKLVLSIILILVIVGASISGVLIFMILSDNSSYFEVEIYDPEKISNGTTLFTDLSIESSPRIVEVDMEGNIVWQYWLPDGLKDFIEPGMDVELLGNGNILLLAPLNGVYEIDRGGNILWSYRDEKISHDADRLLNGNTLINWGGSDKEEDFQVKEVDRDGNIVWSWLAKDHYLRIPYQGIEDQGWTHSNAVTRLLNGNTLINLRNFNLTIEVNALGKVVWEHDWSLQGDDPHEPEILPNGNILIALQWSAPYQIIEIDKITCAEVWKYHRDDLSFARDADRLKNGNTLIQAVVGDSPKIFEVTRDGEIVWQLAVKGKSLGRQNPGWFYKAERVE